MTELVAYEGLAPTDNGRRRWVELMKPAAELANSIAGTDFVPKSVRHNPAAIAACVLYGDEVGLGPMQSLSKIVVVEGRPSLYAEAMRGLILAAGHELWIEDQTTTRVTIAGRRRDSQQVSRVTWTLDDAKRANLAGRENWRKYPRQMLAARATAELARLIFADAIAGLALADDLDGEVLEDAARPDARPANGKRRRREGTTLTRSTRSSPAPDAPRPDPPTPDLPPLPGEEGYGPEEEEEGDGEETADTQSASWKRMHATFREAGYERAGRILYASGVVGRTLTSTRELTDDEVRRILDALADDLAKAEAEATSDAQEDAATPENASQDAGNLGNSVSLAIFRSRVAGEGIPETLKATVGHELFPGRSLSDLNPEELTRFLDVLLERHGEGREDWT